MSHPGQDYQRQPTPAMSVKCCKATLICSPVCVCVCVCACVRACVRVLTYFNKNKARFVHKCCLFISCLLK